MAPTRLVGLVDVDKGGRVRRLALDVTISPPATPPSAGIISYLSLITFGDFGTPVQVTVPPDSRVKVIP